ncbi:MAG: citrate lyase beta chain [Subtercola sp.]|nr:citrate lyase beta chain [Subtercola sp.]
MSESIQIDVTAARSLLFVPGDRPERFDKAVTTGADAVVIDLEDAVAPAAKADARQNVVRWLSDGGRALVRINAPGTAWHDADVEALRSLGVVIMVPKAQSSAELQTVADLLGAAGSAEPRMVALIETVRGVRELDAICAVPAVVRLALGNADLAAELGVDAGSHAALALVRSGIVLASAGAGLVAPVDGITTAFDSAETLAGDLAHGRELGFGGKLCIHPRQVAQVNAGFVPSDTELAWARRVIEQVAGSNGVLAVDGAMIDAPVIRRAEQIVARGSMR